MRRKLGLLISVIVFTAGCQRIHLGKTEPPGRPVAFAWSLSYNYAIGLKSAEIWLLADDGPKIRFERIDRSTEQLLGEEAWYPMGAGNRQADIVVRTRDFRLRDNGERAALVLIANVKNDPVPQVLIYLPEFALKADVPLAVIADTRTITLPCLGCPPTPGFTFAGVKFKLLRVFCTKGRP